MYDITQHLNKQAAAGWGRVDPRMRERLAALLRDMPERLRQGLLISDTARTWEQQVAAGRRHGVDPLVGRAGVLAPWGRGKHHGDNVTAVDFYKPRPDALRWMRERAGAYGLSFPQWGVKSDPWHLEMKTDWSGTLPPASAPSASVTPTALPPLPQRRPGDATPARLPMPAPAPPANVVHHSESEPPVRAPMPAPAPPPLPQQRPGGATPSFASVMAEGWGAGTMNNEEINRLLAERIPQPIKPMNSILADLLGGR